MPNALFYLSKKVCTKDYANRDRQVWALPLLPVTLMDLMQDPGQTGAHAILPHHTLSICASLKLLITLLTSPSHFYLFRLQG